MKKASRKPRKLREWWCVADFESGYLSACISKKAAQDWKTLLQVRADEEFLSAKYKVIKVREVRRNRK